MSPSVVAIRKRSRGCISSATGLVYGNEEGQLRRDDVASRFGRHLTGDEHAVRSTHILLLAVGLALAAAACDFGPVRTVAPDQEGVERIPLEATTALESGDSAIADSLDWPSGRVARGTVTIRREKENILLLEPAQNAALTDSGTAHFADLLGGRYWAWGEHRLSEEEIARLPDDRQATVRALGGGDFTTARRGPGATPFRLPMQANEADGLVISEKSFFVANEKYDYRFFGYVEIYNTGTETVYLDGMVIGRGYGPRSTGDGGVGPAQRR